MKSPNINKTFFIVEIRKGEKKKKEKEYYPIKI